MKKISFVKDVHTGELYGLVIRDRDDAVTIGVTPHGETWANWTNQKSLLSDQITKSLDATLQRSESFDLNAKRLEVLQDRLPEHIFTQVKAHAHDGAMIRRGSRHATMGARFVSKSLSDGSVRQSNTSSAPIASFHVKDRQAALNYKALYSDTKQKYATLQMQVKKDRAIFDPKLGPGGGWRCPDGTLYGGQITDRFGRGCGGGLTRRIGRALMNAGRGLQNIGEGADQRRALRRTQRVERQAMRATQRDERRKLRRSLVGNTVESLAEALIGDYKPLEGIAPRQKRRRKRAGVPDGDAGDLPETPKGRRRSLLPKKPKRTKLDVPEKPSARKKRGEDAKPRKFSKRVREAIDRFADRMVGDYKPLEGIQPRKKRGDKDRTGVRERIRNRIERFAERMIGDYQPLEGISDRRKRRRREVVKPSPKKPSAKKPSQPKPRKKLDSEQVRKQKLAEVNAKLDALIDEEMDIKAQKGLPTPEQIMRLDEIQKEKAKLFVEKAKLTSADPMPQDVTPPVPKVPGKPSAKPKKPKAGKQYGGVYKEQPNARATAVKRAQEDGKALVVVKDANGKFRVVDADRLNDDDSLKPQYTVTPYGSLVAWSDNLSVDENMSYIDDFVKKEEKDLADELKPIPVEELDLELTKSKTGSFLPESLSPLLLEDWRKGADADFRKAFHEERLVNWSFWKNQVGEEKFDDVTDAKGALALIDAHYKQVADTQPVDEALLGILRAERKNFLAMWVPDEGKNEVNFYDRINYVNPKRRNNIVQKADLGGMLVGKKKTAKKEKPKKPNVDAELNVDPVNVPEPDASNVPQVATDKPGNQFNPSKLITFGDDPKKEVMAYKKRMRDNLVNNKPADVFDLVYDSDEDLKAAGEKMADKPSLNQGSPSDRVVSITSELGGLESSIAYYDGIVSQRRKVINDQIDSGGMVTESMVADVIRAENYVTQLEYQRDALEDKLGKAKKDLADFEANLPEVDKPKQPKGPWDHERGISILDIPEQSGLNERSKLLTDDLNNSPMYQTIADSIKSGSSESADDNLRATIRSTFPEMTESEIEKIVAGEAFDVTDDDVVAISEKISNLINSITDKREKLQKDNYNSAAIGQLLADDLKDELLIIRRQRAAIAIESEFINRKKDNVAASSAGADSPASAEPAWKSIDINNDTGEMTLPDSLSWDGKPDPEEFSDVADHLIDYNIRKDAIYKSKLESGALDDELPKKPNGFYDDWALANEVDKAQKELDKALAKPAQNKTYGELTHTAYLSIELNRKKADLEYAKKKNQEKIIDQVNNDPNLPPLADDLDLPPDPELDTPGQLAKKNFTQFKPTSKTIADAKQGVIDEFGKPEFDNESDIDNYYNNIDGHLDDAVAQFAGSESWSDDKWLEVRNSFTTQEDFDQAIRLAKHEKALRKFYKEARQSDKDHFATKQGGPSSETFDPDNPLKSAGSITDTLKALAPDYNWDQQDKKQGDKVSTITGMINNGDSGSDPLAQLPANFYDLSSDEQIDALRGVLGLGPDKTPAQVFGALHKNYALRQNGSKDSAGALGVAQSIAAGSVDSESIKPSLFTPLDVQSFDEAIDKSAIMLDEAMDAMQKANGQLEQLRAKRDVNTARNFYVAALTAKLKDPNSSAAEKKAALKELKQNVGKLPGNLGDDFSDKLLNLKKVDSKVSDKNTPKGMLKTPDFDPTLLGSTNETGQAIALSVDIGNGNMFDVQDAADHLSDGGSLADVPDDLLRDAIVANLGDGKRFQSFAITKGFNKDNFAVVDSFTGKKYIIKTEDRNHMGHIQEAVGAQIANELGFPTPGIRFGSAINDTDLPDARKAAEGIDVGRGRTMIIEHLENQFPGSEVRSIHQIPAGEEISGESIARLMVLDRSINYFDRTAGNMFVVKGSDGKWHLHPIDHGNAFRDYGAGGAEQSAGFTKLTKGDNVDLMGLVAQLSPEEKQAWANGLNKASRKIAKMNFDTSLGDPMKSTQIKSDEDIKRLDQHVAYLKNKQGSLDWDAMTVDALAKAGFTPEEIDEVLTGGPELKKFAIGDGKATPLTGVPEILDGMKDRNTGISRLYDGPDIEFSEIKVQSIKATSVPNPDGSTTKSTPASLVQMKLRGSALAKIEQELTDPAANGWQLLAASNIPGPKYPTLSPKSGELKTFSFAPSGMNTLVSSNGFDTYQKVLPDGQVLMVTKPKVGSGQKNSYRNFAQVLIPGDSKTSLTDEKVAAAMSALGVSETSHPSPEQIRELGVRRLANVILGANNVSSTDNLEDIAQKLEQQGIDLAELRVRTAPDGSQYVGLSTEAASKLAQDLNWGHVHHTLTHASIPTGETDWTSHAISILAGGSINSGTDRYKSGIFVQGWSNSSDVSSGSADYVFTHPRNGTPGDTPSSWSNWSFYAPSEHFAARLDHYSHEGDNCGDIDKRPPLSQTMAYGGHKEMMVREKIPATVGILVVPSDRIDFIKQELANLGITEINGVPVGDIVVTQQDASQAYGKLYARLKAEGQI